MQPDVYMEENFNTSTKLPHRNFGDQFHENSDRCYSKKSDKVDQKLRKLQKSKLIKKLTNSSIPIKMGNKVTKLPLKEPKNRQLFGRRRTFELMSTKSKNAPNDITESSDPDRKHFSNNVFQIMQRTRPMKDRENVRSFLDMTDLWNRKSQATSVTFSAVRRSDWENSAILKNLVTIRNIKFHTFARWLRP